MEGKIIIEKNGRKSMIEMAQTYVVEAFNAAANEASISGFKEPSERF